MSHVSRRSFLSGATLAAAASALTASETGATADTGSLVNVEAFISGVRAARLFDLGFAWDQGSPVRAPTIDATGPIGRNRNLHDGADAAAATAQPDGIDHELGIGAFPVDLLLSRGVLLDVARVVGGGRPDPLPAGFEITAHHLEEALRVHRVAVRRGDSVLIRTGWGQYFATDNARYLGEKSPGPGLDAGRWLVAQGVRLTGTDTATYEVRPAIHGSERFPVHTLLTADHGVYLVENANLEELGAAGVHLFCLVVPPLRIRGASDSPLRMLALTPRHR